MKFTKTFKKIFYFVFTLLFLSGAAWLFLEKFVRVPGAFGEDHHPAQEVLIRIHGAIAYAALIVIGYLTHSHVRPGLKSKKQRGIKTGWMLIVATSLLIVSSAMDLFGPETFVREWLATSHRYVGLFFPLLVVGHVLKDRFAQNSSPRR
jgi:hypothetical protein